MLPAALQVKEQSTVLPAARQVKVAKKGHSLGHFGNTKTKQLLREKYWLALMKSTIDTAVDRCYKLQCREKPIKVTNTPSRPWDTVFREHTGLYPDYHYNLVLINKRTRRPVVEPEASTKFQANKKRVKLLMELQELRVTMDHLLTLK